MIEMIQNTPNDQVPRKKQLRIRESANLTMIDQILFSDSSIPEAQKIILNRFGEKYSGNTLRTRRRELEAKAATIAKVVTENNIVKRELQKEGAYIIKTMGQEAQSIMDLVIPAEHPLFKHAQNLKELITSIVRKSSELYAEIDYLAIHRYITNIQHLRIDKMHELELSMGLPMRDQMENLRLMNELIKDGLELHEEMGLKPRFGDPEQNRQANLGMDDKEAESMKRSREIRRRIDDIKKLPAAEQEKKMAEFKRELISGAVDAKFTDIKPDEVKKPDEDKNESQ